MRGTSRASLAQAKEQLVAAVAAGAPAGELGGDLLNIAELLDREGALRRTLSDPARESRAKAGLADMLLTGKVGAAALGLVRDLVSSRWSEPRDLADAAEQLGVLGIVEQAGQDGQMDDLEDELFRFGRVVSAQSQLRISLSNPFIQADRKRALIGDLLDGKVTPPTLRLVTEAAVRPRGRSLDQSLESYADLIAERRQRLVAEVHVAVRLTDEQRDRLKAALAGVYGHEVYLNIVLDPQVLGGMSVQVGDEVIDGSTASRLAELRRRLAS
ncbi:MAG TPA: F0F1 ATP synthase subunit delta [Streptosporangiaceae bacterium]